MSDQLPDPAAFIGPIARGKAPLPADADADQCAAVLRRALYTIECRELGPEAAGKKFGPFADTMAGVVSVLMDESQARARHLEDADLHRLACTVQERGPAVDVALAPPRPTTVVLDEMAHVANMAADLDRGADSALTGPARCLSELSRPRQPLWWSPRGDRGAAYAR